MAAISSSVMIQAIEDGSTIHGSLLTYGALSQAYSDGGAVVPNWDIDEPQPGEYDPRPIVYLSLLKGTVQKAQLFGYQDVDWYYNDVRLVFDSVSNKSINSPGSGIPVGAFLRLEYNGVPALKIIKNIANSADKDNDELRFSGVYREDGANIPLDLSVNVRISIIRPGAYFGVLMPCTKVQYGASYRYVKGGDFALEDDNSEVAIYAELYDSTGLQVDYHANKLDTSSAKNYYADYELSPLEVDESASDCFVDDLAVYRNVGDAAPIGYFPTLILTDQEVVDYVIAECKYWKNWDESQGEAGYSEMLCSAWQEVDDLDDIEMIYVEALHRKDSQSTITESGEGKTAYLRAGEIVDFNFWVGKQDNIAVDTKWNYFYVKFVSNGNEPYTDTISGIANILPNAGVQDADYAYRPVYDETNYPHHGKFSLGHSSVVMMGGKVTGWLSACTQRLPHDQQPNSN